MTEVPPGDLFTRRICLQLDGMDDVSVRRDIAYGPPGLGMDLYYPTDEPEDPRLPAVIIVAGYPGTMEPRRTPSVSLDMARARKPDSHCGVTPRVCPDPQIVSKRLSCRSCFASMT